MLIIEGPDGVGKTTLCKQFCKLLPTHVYAHFTRLPEKFDRYWGYVERMSRNIVQDRLHMSEIVYAQARGEDTQLTPERYKLVDAKLRLLGAYTVLITADADIIRSRWDETQMYSLEKTLKAAEIFDELHLDEDFHGDVDFCFRCCHGAEYVSQEAVIYIIDEYRRRQELIDELAANRPRTL